MNEPTTEAGRRLLTVLPGPNEHGDRVVWEDAILAIEQEAVAKYRRELRAEVEALPKWDKRSVPGGFHVNLAAVLALLGEPNDD